MEVIFSITGWCLSPTPLKNMSLSVGMIIPQWKNNKCLNPPTSFSSNPNVSHVLGGYNPHVRSILICV